MSIFVYLCNEPTFSFISFLYCFSILYFIYLRSNLYLLSTCFEFNSSFSVFISWKYKLLIRDPCSFLINKSTGIKFPLSIAFTTSHKLWYIVFLFSFNLKCFLNSSKISILTHCLFKHVLFNFYIFVSFPDFFLLLVSNFIPCGQRRYFVYF